MKKLTTILYPIVLLLSSLLFATAVQANSRTIQITIQTEQGDIEAVLFPEKAPVTVANFLANIARGIYVGGQFYRASDERHASDRPLHIIQGGKAESKPDTPPFAHEPTSQTGLLNEVGTLSMARLDPGTAQTEFFINVKANAILDTNEEKKQPGYAVFGKVTKGLEVVQAIQAKPTGNRKLSAKEKETLKKIPDFADAFVAQLMDKSVIIKNIITR